MVAWSVAYLATSAVCALVAIYCVLSRLARPAFSGLGRIRGELREGFWFSTSLSAQTIYNDVDKTMLARLATLDAAGIYAAAYRLIDIAFLPIRALLAAAYPSFFRHGEDGIGGSLSLCPAAPAQAAGVLRRGRSRHDAGSAARAASFSAPSMPAPPRRCAGCRCCHC